VKLLIDEHLSPGLVIRCAQKGLYAVAVAHVGLSGRQDEVIWRYALENDFIVVTANTRDFTNLLDIDIDLHPGVIMLREGSLSRDEQWHRLELALDDILKHADPAGYMINRVVEVMSAREIRVREIPPGEP
jgi:predicted nuclease of predicted toxin-antitoxin system